MARASTGNGPSTRFRCRARLATVTGARFDRRFGCRAKRLQAPFRNSARASKLANVAVSGAPEDQLRGPLDVLVRDLAEIAGLPVGAVHLVGETAQTELKTFDFMTELKRLEKAA